MYTVELLNMFYVKVFVRPPVDGTCGNTQCFITANKSKEKHCAFCWFSYLNWDQPRGLVVRVSDYQS